VVGLVVGSFDEEALLELSSCADECDEGALKARHLACADSMSLKAIAMPAAIRPTCGSGIALHSSLAVTGSVIPSAGLVLAGTFSVLAVLPSVG
jgi:hypothetical protein